MAKTEKRRRVPSEDCMRLRKTFARNIRAWAEMRGLSLNHLADRSGVSRAQMYNVLSGSSSPSLDWITKIAPVLGVQVWELLVAVTESEPHAEVPGMQPAVMPMAEPMSHMAPQPAPQAMAPAIQHGHPMAPMIDYAAIAQAE